MREVRPERFEVLPLVVKNLLIINGLFFLAEATVVHQFHIPIMEYMALHSWRSPLFKPWQVLTHLFLHDDFYHLAGNMFALWMFGSVLESLWGAKRFLTFYFICGFGAALLHLVFLNWELGNLTSEYLNILSLEKSGKNILAIRAIEEYGVSHGITFNQNYLELLHENPENRQLLTGFIESVSMQYQKQLDTHTIGASGAVFGLLAAFVYLFPNTYLYFYFFIPVKAKWAGLAYFSYELIFAIKNAAGDNVARWAHVGGAIVGLLIVWTWNKKIRDSFY